VTSSGLAAVVGVTGADPGFDDLIVVAAGGNDLVDASAVRAGALKLTLNGSDGNDALTGGDGDDFLIGGPDNDVMRGGPGNDIFDNSEGTDTVFQE
jgi:Ca2+-binding RTX toxin-like protein